MLILAQICNQDIKPLPFCQPSKSISEILSPYLGIDHLLHGCQVGQESLLLHTGLAPPRVQLPSVRKPRQRCFIVLLKLVHLPVKYSVKQERLDVMFHRT